ncbi:hypothetical protein ABB37_09788 [Leptomonas pyrrhocoris]|uniref:Membrane-associated protein n=1 Tax=Leptomonas pyrrhocoris TaxID=157538 RepID=A0A0M9FPJ8_LEPPY|nr:hypothetical protein ABB37_09788 [Leptomonas pyrrhocoris]KPA73460.1 hypothetical protein ABB37_09788 [Leptomonas pyrrhocoris]|eukprot:XP_015651899.1 hypothetical protein ABB37_09788 [Leptomonas pyrrhocoris]
MSFLVGIGTTRLSRPRHRLLLAICLLWTLECCVLSCASAAIFDASAVSVVARVTPQFNTEAGQRLECDRVGGSLFTDVSTAVHAKLRAHMINHVGVSTYIGYLGGSSAQSPACPTTGPSLKCIWRWDSGRYGAVETVFLFYKGNAPPQKLLGVGPLNNLPSFWYSANSTQQYPESHHQQHLVMMQTAGRSAAWKDSSPAKFSYSTLNTGTWYALCMLTSAATKTRMAPTSQTRRSSPLQSRESVSSAGGAAPDGFLSLATYDGTDTQPKNSSTPLSAGAWAGIGVVIGVVATAFVVGVVCVLGKYHGWCCFGISTRADAAAADASSSSSDSRRNAGEDIRPSFASRSASTSAATSRSVSDRVVAKTPAGAPGGFGERRQHRFAGESADGLCAVRRASSRGDARRGEGPRRRGSSRPPPDAAGAAPPKLFFLPRLRPRRRHVPCVERHSHSESVRVHADAVAAAGAGPASWTDAHTKNVHHTHATPSAASAIAERELCGPE